MMGGSLPVQADLVALGPGADGRDRGYLTRRAAASVFRIDKRLGRPLDVNSAWRDPVVQDRMYRAWIAWVTGRGPRPNHGRALPSTESVHCRGEAIDTDDTELERILNDHGWYRTAADEGWHYEYFPDRDNHRQKEDDMPVTDREMDAIAARVWGYRMNGGVENGDEVPTETAGERLRNIRRSTKGLKGRTVAILTGVRVVVAWIPGTDKTLAAIDAAVASLAEES